MDFAQLLPLIASAVTIVAGIAAAVIAVNKKIEALESAIDNKVTEAEAKELVQLKLEAVEVKLSYFEKALEEVKDSQLREDEKLGIILEALQKK